MQSLQLAGATRALLKGGKQMHPSQGVRSVLHGWGCYNASMSRETPANVFLLLTAYPQTEYTAYFVLREQVTETSIKLLR